MPSQFCKCLWLWNSAASVSGYSAISKWLSLTLVMLHCLWSYSSLLIHLLLLAVWFATVSAFACFPIHLLMSWLFCKSANQLYFLQFRPIFLFYFFFSLFAFFQYALSQHCQNALSCSSQLDCALLLITARLLPCHLCSSATCSSPNLCTSMSFQICHNARLAGS